MSTDLSPTAQIVLALIIVVVLLIVKRVKSFSSKELASWFLGTLILPWEIHSTRGRLLALAILLPFVALFTIVLVGMVTGR